MIDPHKIAEFDQAVAGIRELIPRSLYAIYEGCMKEGFSEQQALDLTKQWLAISMYKPPETTL